MMCPFCPMHGFRDKNEFAQHLFRGHDKKSFWDICEQYVILFMKIQDKISEWEVVTGDQDYEWKADVLKELIQKE